MNLKMRIRDSYKNFKMNGIKNHKYSLNQVLIAIMLSNLMILTLNSPASSAKQETTPKKDHLFIRVPLKLMIPYTKGFHFTVINQDQKIIIEEAVFVEEIKKDESQEAGLYLIEISKKISAQVPQLLKQDLTAIPQMTTTNKVSKSITRGVIHEDMEINF